LFPTAIGPVDVGTTYANLRLIALRLDPCSARKSCNSEVRAIFHLFDGADLARQPIATTSIDEQQVTGTHPDPLNAGGIVMVSPALDSPLIALVDENRPADATDQIRAGFGRAIELQDPTKENSESVDCVSCHLTEGARRIGAAQYGLSSTAAFQSDRSLDYQRDLGAVTNLHMFAYDGRYVSVTQRVANESAVTADALQELVK
jgi:hypothetical protein